MTHREMIPFLTTDVASAAVNLQHLKPGTVEQAVDEALRLYDLADWSEEDREALRARVLECLP